MAEMVKPALMVAVGQSRSKAVAAWRTDAARADLDEHGEQWCIDWLCAPKEHGLWVIEGSMVDGIVHWPQWPVSWRRATVDEAFRFAAGQEVWP